MKRTPELILAALATLTLVAADARAGDPTLEYETTISGYFLASGHGLEVDAAGNAYLIARTVDQDQNDILLAKVDAAGSPLWMVPVNGSGHDHATDLTLGPNGDVYVTGWTDSPDFPVANPLDATLTGFRDVFVMRLSAQTGAIVYSTFLGGDYADHGGGIAVAGDGTIVLAGYTESSDFPTVNPMQPSINGAPYGFSDMFVTRLSADGGTILYSTYLGGTRDDRARDVALDADGAIHVVGETDSTDLPLQLPLQSTLAGEDDGLALAISADGSQLLFSTYLGGEDQDRVARLALDPLGAVYVAGSTRSVGFPTTPGSYQPGFAGAVLGCSVPFGGSFNCDDGFVTKLLPGGAGFAYSTYLGGSEVDEIRDLAVDALGQVRVVGYTGSDDFPPSGTSFAADIFVSALSTSGADLLFTHLVASGSANQGHGVAVDLAGDTYFTGGIDVPSDVYVSKLVGGVPSGEPGVAYCSGTLGEGSACPCANENDGSLGLAGCANGSSPGGGALRAVGQPSLSAGGVQLRASGLVPNQPILFFQGDERVLGGDGTPFGDGLRCAGSNVVRLEVRFADSGGAAATTVDLVAEGGASAGDLLRYQGWYRDPAASPCGFGFNLTNGYELTWQP